MDTPEVTGTIVAAPHSALVLAAPLVFDESPARVYLSRLPSPASKRVMESSLKSIATELCEGATPDTIAWHALRYQHGMALRARLASKHEPRTVNRMLSALRGVIEEAINLGLMSDADGGWRTRLHGVKYDKRALSGRALETDEVGTLMSACDRATLFGARNAAMVAFLFGAGLRREELAGVRMEDYSRGLVSVVGKGSKARTVRLATDAAEIVDEYLRMRGYAGGPLLVSFHVDGMPRMDGDEPTGLSATGIYEVLVALAKRAKTNPLSPHDARRSRITKMIAEGESLAAVRRVAGHESSETTDRYDRTKDELAHAAAARVKMLK